jgi:hypothetical protein
MIIKDRILCGHKSKNGRYYTKSALERAIPLFEGTEVFLDHCDNRKDRKFADLLGKAVNVRYTPNGIRGDLQLDDNHQEAKRLQGIVEQNLPLGGISGDFDFTLGSFEGKTYVCSIDRVNSLDLVALPATSHITESEDTQIDPAVEQAVVNFVTKEQFDNVVSQLTALQAAQNTMQTTLEAKIVAQSPPAAPLPPAYVPSKSTQNIEDLIRACR